MGLAGRRGGRLRAWQQQLQSAASDREPDCLTQTEAAVTSPAGGAVSCWGLDHIAQEQAKPIRKGAWQAYACHECV